MPYKFDTVSVLVIEDNQPMAMMVRAILQTFGVKEIIVSKNGEDGFETFCKHNPDIVIADWMMKPIDGIVLTKMIRAETRSPNPFVPIILMTGFSERGRVATARDCGVTEFLVKPFEAKQLYKRIAQVIERPRQFVRSEGFFGPDRRRNPDPTFAGPWRRVLDHKLTGESK